MKLRDVMTPNPQTVEPDAPVEQAARIMRDSDTGVVPVVQHGRPVGMVTDRDIVVRAVAEGREALGRPVSDFASTDLVTAPPEMSTKEAAALMGQRQVRRLLVCENDRVVGVASLGDLAVKDSDDRAGTAIKEISQGVKG